MPDDNGKKRKAVSLKQLEANRRNAQKSTGPKDTSVTRLNALKHGLLSKEVVIKEGDGKENEEEFRNLLEQLNKDYSPQGAVEEMLVERIAISYWRLRRALRHERGLLREGLDSLYHDYYNKEDWKGRKINRVDDQAERERLQSMIEVNLGCIKLLKDGLDISVKHSEKKIDMEEYYFNIIAGEYDEGALMGENFDKRKFADGKMTIPEMREHLGKEGWTDDLLRENFIEQDMEGIDRFKALINEIDKEERVEKLKLSRLADLKSLPSAKEIDKLLKYEGTIERQLYKAINQLERLQRMRQGEIVPPPINLNIDIEK